MGGETPAQKADREKADREKRVERMKASGAVYDKDNIAGKAVKESNMRKEMDELNEIKGIRPAAAIAGALLAKKFLGPKRKEEGSEVGNAARAALRGAIAAGGAIAGWKAGKALKAAMADDDKAGKKPKAVKSDTLAPGATKSAGVGRTSSGMPLIKQQ